MKDLHSLSNSWRTPSWLFDELNQEFNFDIDLCATKENSKCGLFGHNYLKNEYSYTLNSRHIYTMGSLNGAISEFYDYEYEASCFMNPPYSNPKPFIEKAWQDSKHCKIVCLVKCDPSTRWWSTFWNYGDVEDYRVCHICKGDGLNSFNKEVDCRFCAQGKQWFLKEATGPKPGCDYKFFTKRIKFDPPQQLIDSGEVWKQGIKWCGKCMTQDGQLVPNIDCIECKNKYVHRKWVQKCNLCKGTGERWTGRAFSCGKCDGKGYKELSGPTFSSALLIFDRRDL